jgi:competence protein ComEA
MVKKPLNPHFFCRWAIGVLVAIAALAFSLGNVQAQSDLLDINTATQQELKAVKGVGAATAKKIIDNRPYKSLDELSKAGLSAKKIASLKSSVTVGKAAAAPAPAPAAKPGAKKAPGATPEPAAAAPVDLNKADQAALESLPGIGPALAKKIMAGRPFQSVDDLSRIRGMSKAKIKAIQDQVTVAAAKPSQAAPAPAAAKPKGTPALMQEVAPSQAKPAVGKEAAPSHGTPAAAKLAPGEKVNINTAPKEELDKLPGIGPVKAEAILEARPFEKIEDIMKVKGIKEGEFGKIKDLITVK